MFLNMLKYIGEKEKDIMLKDFLSPEDFVNYPPCGMFTLGHIISFVVCMILMVSLLYISYKKKNLNIKKIIKVTSVVLLVLEILKTVYHVYYSYLKLEQIIPLSYCSLFIYAMLMSGFGKGKVEKIGNCFISGGCIVAGFAFLIFPTTSLMLHPLFHALSIHSMLYHTTMVFFGILLLLKKVENISFKNFVYYSIFTVSFLVLTIILNVSFDGNLMFINDPVNIPFDFINKVYEKAPFIYTLSTCIMYESIYFVPLIVKFIKNKIKQKRA